MQFDGHEPVRWKPIKGFPLYEISEEGQIRIVLAHPEYSGHIKRRFRWVYDGVNPDGSRTGRAINYNKSMSVRGTLYVDMTIGTLGQNGIRKPFKEGNRSKGNPRFKRSIADLMDKHWPGLEYPKDWRSDKSVIVDPRIRKGPKSVSNHELLKIMDDERDATIIWRASKLGKRRAWIDQIHKGGCSLARRLKEYGRDALYEEEAVYWWDSEERGHRIKKLILGDLPNYYLTRKSHKRSDRARYV